MSLRLVSRHLVSITCRPTAAVVDSTGGIARLQKTSAYSFTFLGVILPPRRRVTRAVSGVRLATLWSVIAQGSPGVKEQDRLYFPGDNRVYSVTAIKRYPRHTVYDLEVLQ